MRSSMKEKIGFEIIRQVINYIAPTLFLVISGYFTANFFQDEKSTSFLGLNEDFLFIVCTFTFLYLLVFLARRLHKLLILINDERQTELNHEDFFDTYDFQVFEEDITKIDVFHYLVYKGRYPINPQHKFSEGIIDISNPKCSDEKCLSELIPKKTFLNTYTYYCPSCDSTQKSKFSPETLKKHTLFVLEKNILQKDRREKKAIQERQSRELEALLNGEGHNSTSEIE